MYDTIADKDMLEQYLTFPTAILSLIKNKVGVMCSEIKPLSEKRRMVGTAYTINEEDNSLDMLDKLKPEQIIVIAGGGHREFSIWGWFSNYSAINRKARGVVIDGAISGIKSLRQSEIPVFARAITPLIGGHNSGARVNVPIKCGGVLVNPGDIVVGDDDGAVVVPHNEAEMVAKAVKEIIAALDFIKNEMIKERKPLDEVRHIQELYEQKNKEQSTYWQAYGPWLKKYGSE